MLVHVVGRGSGVVLGAGIVMGGAVRVPTGRVWRLLIALIVLLLLLLRVAGRLGAIAA